jgi:hypothetical protein
MVLQPGTAAQLASQLAQLVTWGASRQTSGSPGGDPSVLSQAVADAGAYVAHLRDNVPAQATYTAGSSIYETADALADLIVSEAGPPPPAQDGPGFPWLAVAAMVGAGAYAWQKGWLR